MGIPKHFLAGTIGVLSLASLANGQASVVRDVISAPYSTVLSVGCALPIDSVLVTGTARTQFRTVIDGNGGVHLDVQTFVSYEGIGLPSGASYRGTGRDFFLSNQSSTSAHNELTSFVDTILVGQGDAPNLNLRTQFHLTVRADNEITADVVNVTVTCK